VQIGMGENIQILAFIIVSAASARSAALSWRPDRVKLPS
jgi:hypothetical protein